jgi:hypothetical protein
MMPGLASRTPAAAMDKLVSHTYLEKMLTRLVSMLAMLAIAVMTTATPGHAALMSMTSGSNHATHAGEMMHATHDAHTACHGEEHCGSAEVGMCEVACAGVSVCLATPDADTERGYGPDIHLSPGDIRHIGHAPGLNERPPKLRLL